MVITTVLSKRRKLVNRRLILVLGLFLLSGITQAQESAEVVDGEYDTDGDGEELIDGDGTADYESEVDDVASSPNRGDLSVFARPGAGGGDYTGATDANGPCADYRPGEDDLQAFDFIRQFRLDVLETKYPGVKRVQGSSRLQTAYKLENEADLVLPTRNIFPQGLPQQFSFICTFRTKKPPKTAWNIIRISDIRQRPQFQVTFNPRKTSIEFAITDFQGKLQTLVFTKAQVFDKEWHKVHFGVHRERVVLYIDCEFSQELPLDVRGPIDVNGEIAISKVAGTKRTVPMELQWMVMSCDPNRPERETCEECRLRGNKFNRPALRRVLLVYRDSTAPPVCLASEDLKASEVCKVYLGLKAFQVLLD